MSGAPRAFVDPDMTMDAAMLADLIKVYDNRGSITQLAYQNYGRYGVHTIIKRWGKFELACEAAGLQHASKRKVEKVTTTCLVCDGLMERPKDDPSCRKCKTCRNAKCSDLTSDNWKYLY